MQDRVPETALLNYEELATLATDAGRPEVARDLYTRACTLYQPTSRILRTWGMLEKRLKNVTGARKLFGRSLDCDAMDVKTWMMWGLLERSEGELDAALHMFRQVRASDNSTSITNDR